MNSIRNVLTVFLASPSDLLQEREEVKKIVERINKGIGANVGWTIDLLGWEDTRPGFSRPQSLINKDVERCDLFLGVLWKRWGQPTGAYDSGFREEYCLAKELNLTKNTPDIWIYFKKIDEDNYKDPGDQLKKVIKFKSDLIKKKELYFKEFKDNTEWVEVVFDDLQNYLFELSKENKIIEGESIHRQSIKLKKSGISSKSVKGSIKQFPPELIILINKLKLNYEKNELNKIDIWDRIRLYLNAAALISDKFSDEQIGNHEINFLYLKRKRWSFIKEESLFLFKSILCDKNALRPGWYWFKDWSESIIDETLCSFAENNNDLSTKQMCLFLLAETNYRADNKFISKFISHENVDIVLSIIKLIKNSNKTEFSDALAEKISTSNSIKIKNSAIETLFEMQFDNDPNIAFQNLINYGTDIPSKLKSDKSLLTKINSDTLIKSLNEGSSNIKLFVAKYLVRSSQMNDQIIEILSNNSDLEVRKEFFIHQIEKNKISEISQIEKWISDQKEYFNSLSIESKIDKDELLVKILLNKEKDELLKEFNKITPQNIIYYRVLAESHFSFFENQIKSDLDNDFKEIVSKYSQMIFGNDFDTPANQELIEFLKSKYISAALKGIKKNGNQSSVKYARKYLGKNLYNLADSDAIEIIAKYGNKSDINVLKKSLLKFPRNLKKLAIEASIKLSINKENLIKRLLGNSDNEVVVIAAQHIRYLSKEIQINISKKLLLNKNRYLRSIGLSILISKCHSDKLKNILDKYLRNNTYYYNVVTWIDRCIYTQGRYQDYFKKQIIEFEE